VENKFDKIIRKLIYLAVIAGPLMNLPQLFKIWYYQNAAGVSLISWLGFSTISIVWFLYGISRKDKPIIYMNFSLIIIQLMIALGTLIYG